jgi:hypothetical protein
MSMHTDADLLAGLRGLADGLEADGYTLEARWASEEEIVIDIDATPEACADCLVPRDVMRGIASSMLEGVGIDVAKDRIAITYPPGSAAH